LVESGAACNGEHLLEIIHWIYLEFAVK
jgi:hypothetical protein